MSKRRGTRRWLGAHRRDRFVREASAQGYRSRAAFKLIQLDDRLRLLRPGSCVVDLGAAPGGWTQVAVERVGAAGCVLAADRDPMEPLPGATFVRGDLTDAAVRARLRDLLARRPPDLVMSDMAPNLTGLRDIDQARAAELAVMALDFALEALRPGGTVLVKVFHGVGMDDVVTHARENYESVILRKPPASRARSAEAYVVGRRSDGIL